MIAFASLGSIVFGIFQMQQSCLSASSDLPLDWSEWRPNFAAMIAYEPEMQLWSDGLTKERFLCLPQGASLSTTQNGKFAFPVGTVLWKTFLHQAPGASQTVPIEFRAMQRTDSGWQFATYSWNATTQQAQMVLEPQYRDLVSMDESTASPVRHTWQIPNSDQCLMCHHSGELGLTPQNISGVTQAQWREQGFLDQIPTLERPALVRLDDPSAPIELRARGYLEVNCAHCHGAQIAHGSFTFDLATPLAQAGLLNEDPEFGDLGIDGAKRVQPQHPERSVVALRMAQTDFWRMPRMGSARTHAKALETVRTWISNLVP